MSYKLLSPIVWATILFCSIEFAFELRARTRGYPTLLLPSSTTNVSSEYESALNTRYGPRHNFPFRSKIIAEQKEVGERRIWISSSSHAADELLPAAEVFPNLMMTDSLRWSVMNASRGGFTIRDNVEQLNEIGAVWSPDVVVLYHAANDLSRLARFRKDDLESQIENKEPSKFSHFSPTTYVNHLSEQLTLYNLLKTNFTTRISKARLLKDGLPRNCDEDFTKQLDGFIEAVNASGATPVLCTFATSHSIKTLGELPADSELTMLRHVPSLTKLGWASTIARWNKLIKDYGARHGVIVLDVANEFTGEASSFRDFVHFSPEGHRKMAAYLSDQIIRLFEVSEEGK